MVAEDDMRGWGPGQDVDAGLLRDLLLCRGLDGDPDPRGLWLRGARVRNVLDLDFVDSPVALHLVDCLLEQGISAERAHLPMLRVVRCRLGPVNRPALAATGLRVDGLDLRESIFSTATEQGAVSLVGARVGGQLRLSGAALRNSAGPALNADGLQTDASVFLDEGFSVEGSGDGGAIRLLGARVGDQLILSSATLRNPCGPALAADRLQTEGSVFLDEGFSAQGSGARGTVRLFGARIGDQLNLRGATLRNSTGPAFAADGLQTGGDVALDEGFSAEGSGANGAVRLSGARIGDQLSLRGATLRNPAGPALAGDRLQTGSNVLLDGGFSANGSGRLGVILLDGARVGGALVTPAGDGVCSDSHAQHLWAIDGLTCIGVPRPSGQAWLDLLRTSTARYAAQPYQQLAAAYRAEGHDGEVRQVLMAQRRDQIIRGGLNRAERAWAKTTGLLLGYGYQPWRALLYLAGVLAVSVVLALVLGAHGALARTTTPPTQGPAAPACTVIQTIGRGLDLGAPFLPVSPATIGSCQPTAEPAGDALTVIRWLLQLVAWALAALFIAGFTGIVRKT
jgi:hypothetical protein